MNEYSGYIFQIDESQRSKTIKNKIISNDTFTDTISAQDTEIKLAEIFFISLNDGFLDYIALGRLGNRVATQKHQLRFVNLKEIIPPIPVEEIQNQIKPQLKSYFIKSSSGFLSRMPVETWKEFLNIIKNLRPNIINDLEKLERLRKLRPDYYEQEGFRVVAEERDSVNLALRIAGFDHSEFLDWETPSTNQIAPFLQGLSVAQSREDPFVIHDSKVFGDWKNIASHQVGSAIFQKNGEVLTILNVNRHKVEETLGVDLLYYLHEHKCYVMVQYKRMIRESDTFVYRPNDKSYNSEIARMKEFEKKSTTRIGD